MSSDVITDTANASTAEMEQSLQSTPTAVSVIICTRDRPDTIVRAAESVMRQTFSSFDILIVDQSRTDETRRLVEDLMERCARLHYLHLDQAGLSRAYNAGIRHTKGELLAFTDDDCVAPESWLDALARRFAEQPDVGLLYGQVLLPPELARTGTPGGTIPTLPIPQRQRLSLREGFKVFGMGANFAACRSVCEQIDGFDEILGGGGPLKSSQDFDFAYRVYRAGGAILLEPDVVIYHYGFRSDAEWPATLKAYGIGDGAFYLKHVRTGDLYAARLLARQLFVNAARELRHTIMPGSRRAQWGYVRNVVRGMYDSLKFGVDRRQRRYYAR
jgi:GT2 family glycosyltransferase